MAAAFYEAPPKPWLVKPEDPAPQAGTVVNPAWNEHTDKFDSGLYYSTPERMAAWGQTQARFILGEVIE